MSPALARRLVRRCGLDANELRLLGEGDDSIAFEVDGRWVFRFPKRAEVVPHLRSEIAVLPLLDLPVAIPRFTHVGAPGEGYPFPFVGYEKLPGVPLDTVPEVCPEPLLDELARVLDALHATPIEGPVVEVRGWDHDHDVPDHPVLQRAAAWLEANPLEPAVRALCHDDLGTEHILIDPDTHALTGIIDWGDLSLTDPAVDLVGLLAWRPEAFVPWHVTRGRPAEELRRVWYWRVRYALQHCVHVARSAPDELESCAARLARTLTQAA